MKTKLLHVMTLLKIKNKGKHCNLSASLSYPDILRLLKIIPTKLVNTPHHFSRSSPERYLRLDICSGMKLLVKTCCKITFHVPNKRFMTEEILPCMEIHTNFSETLPLRTKTTNKLLVKWCVHITLRHFAPSLRISCTSVSGHQLS